MNSLFAAFLGLFIVLALCGLISGAAKKPKRKKAVQYPMLLEQSPPTGVTWTLTRDFVAQITKAEKDHDYALALAIARKAMVWTVALAKECEAGQWGVPTSMPVVDCVLRYAPVALDRASLEYMLR